MSTTPFARLADLGEQLEATTKRTEMADLLAGLLHDLAPAEVPPAVRMIVGQVFPEWDERSLNVSWKAVKAVVDDLHDASPTAQDAAGGQAVDSGDYIYLLLAEHRRQPPSPPALGLLEVYETFEEIAATAGRGSVARKKALLHELFGRASAVEAKYLAKITFQEMRHGVSEGIMLDGIARASGIKSRLVRRANQLWGDLGEVALVALTEGEVGLRGASVRLFQPLKPMLAQTAHDMAEAFEQLDGHLALEYKLDGARVQIHRQGDQVRIYSRNLADVTGSLPDVASDVQARMSASEAVLEGEAVAVDSQGRPLPFQHLMRRFRRKHAIAATLTEVPVQLYLFDALYVHGRSIVDEPYETRWAALVEAAGELDLVPRVLPASTEEGEAFAQAAYRGGHEGVMAKALGSTYNPGLRGKAWLKLKHVLSLDLVVVAAEWGYGRRHGWLSNYHLGALDPKSGECQLVGKTFKGLTDAQFEAMTERLLALEQVQKGNTVVVRPQVVVEVLFNEIQASRQYASGLALRFARISRIRDDKPLAEADTLQTVQWLYQQQFRYKGQVPGEA